MERKTFRFDIKEVKEDGTFEGYAAVFGNIDCYNDVIEPGAFTQTLKEQPGFKMFWYHNPTEPLGTYGAAQDLKGLKGSGKFTLAIQKAKEIYAWMKDLAATGIPLGLSIGFEAVKFTIDGAIRRLQEIKLYEISLCSFQANVEAVVTEVKSMELKPFPNEHAARLLDPDKCDDFRRKKDGKLYNKIDVPETIAVIWGHLKGGADDAWPPQSLRFPIADWTVEEARAWLKDNEVKFISFEPAEKSIEGIIEAIRTFKPEESKEIGRAHV